MPQPNPAAAKILTVVLIAGIFGYFVYRQRAAGRPAAAAAGAATENTPEAAIWRMVDATRSGDIEQYLGCYSGELEQQLRQNARDMGPAKFAGYLTGSYSQLKGVAVSGSQPAAAGGVSVPVEYVYQDRNERQQIYLRQVNGEWRIFRVETAERIPTLVPYGTPVKD